MKQIKYHQFKFELEYSFHNTGSSSLEFVFNELSKLPDYRMEIVETEPFLRLNFFLWDRDFLRLQIFKSNKIETFPRLQFKIFRDQDFLRVDKNCRDRDFSKTLTNLYYLCSKTTFIFYGSFNSNIWFKNLKTAVQSQIDAVYRKQNWSDYRNGVQYLFWVNGMPTYSCRGPKSWKMEQNCKSSKNGKWAIWYNELSSRERISVTKFQNI